ncbi:MAG: N-acetylmuramic acid 6-phosphate etherase [Pararhodobacter sp.]|nr:N-acetylmuramic acid 6-phosphate etherase [Pararhodobacter sp.]
MADTESGARRYRDIENWPADDMMAALIEAQMGAVALLQQAAPALAAAAEAAAARLAGDTGSADGGGRLIYLGAGTSGRIAAQDAAELAPTFGWPRERALVLMAGGGAAYAQAVEGAEDDAEAARRAIDKVGASAGDVAIALAASGRTPFTLAGLARARAAGALAIAIVNNAGSELAGAADHAIVLPTGPEPIAGSTRMKAGTAQRAALTCLSSAIFMRMGHVWRGRMVAMVPGNAKLRARARAMVEELTGMGEAAAAQALDATDGEIRPAVLMLLAGLDAPSARARLRAVGGRLGEALGGEGFSDRKS